MQTSVLMDYAADVIRSLPRFEAKKIEAATVTAYAASYGERPVRITWADRVGIYMAAAGFGLVAYIWLMAVMAVGYNGANHLLAHGMGLLFEGILATSLTIWLICRVSSWITNARRRLIEEWLEI